MMPIKESLQSANEQLVLETRDARLVVDPLGARILHLDLGGSPVLVSVKRRDGKEAATHPCTPNFGKEEPNVYNLPQHGPARNALWKVIEKNNESTTLQYEIDHPGYPTGVMAIRTFSLYPKEFVLTVRHVHTGNIPAPINYGEHCYFHTGSFGWNTLEINDVPVAELVEANATVPLDRENHIRVSGRDSDVILVQEGLPLAMLWAASKNGVFDTQYVCIEPIIGDPQAFWNSEKSILHPKKERIVKLGLQLR